MIGHTILLLTLSSTFTWLLFGYWAAHSYKMNVKRMFYRDSSHRNAEDAERYFNATYWDAGYVAWSYCWLLAGLLSWLFALCLTLSPNPFKWFSKKWLDIF